MFITIWQYTVKKGREQEFESAYGADGAWVRLFKGSNAYFGTELLKTVSVERCYITIDRWKSEGEYTAYRQERSAEYERIDSACEVLTETEARVGEYEIA